MRISKHRMRSFLLDYAGERNRFVRLLRIIFVSFITMAPSSWGYQDPSSLVNGNVSSADGANSTYSELVTIEDTSCWVFHHLVKSGGKSVKAILKYWRNTHKPSRHHEEFAAKKWRRGSDVARKIADGSGKASYFIHGGYAETLRPYGGADTCKWFTIFRHPIPRVVSAYYHCQTKPKDPLCATVVVSAADVDLHTFAEHWSNFGLRQFALAYVSQDVLIRSEAARKCPRCPGWYILKSHFTAVAAAEVSDVIDGGMTDLLQPVGERLENEYAAVGVLENFNATMHLFNRALTLPGLDWADAAVRKGPWNVAKTTSQYRDMQAFEDAWNDSILKKFIALDISLYEHAVSVHEKQLKDYGL